MVLDQVFIFITFAIITGTATKLLNKYVITETDPYAYALITNMLAAIIFLFLALTKFTLPKEPMAWIILAIASVLWPLIAVTVLISYKSTEISIRDPLNQSKILIALILGALFLREAVTYYRIIGNIIIFLGITTLIYHPERKFGKLSDPGVRWTFLAALLSALVAIIDKSALKYFNLETYGFMVFFFPAIILSLFIRKRLHHVNHLLKIRWKSALIAIILSAVTYYFILKSFSLADVTLVYPLLQLSVLLTVIGGILIMKEREHFWQKIIATVIIIIGSIILRL